MPRTANPSGRTAQRKNPAAKNTDDAVLEALNADRAAPDHSKQRADAREAESIEESSLPEDPARSRPAH